MTAAPTLGPVAFSGFEVPERISFGGKQRLVVHTMPGGARVIDAMGPDDAPIRWSGVFSGTNSASRVRVLERLRRSGSPLLLTWDGWRFRVIVQQFDAQVTNANWIPYSIELCVIPASIGLTADWLLAAAAPALTVAALSAATLASGIEASGAALSSDALGAVVSASGQLAQYVTQRAYAGAVT